TGDGGYALASETESFGAGDCDFWLVKTNSTGHMMWNQTYGGTGEDVARSMVQTADGGYALAGYTLSFGAGGYDFWLVKIDSAGNMQWIRDWFRSGLAWMDSTADTITLYRGATDAYWNYVRVRIWKIKHNP
ncbi:hypothetical protein KAU92_05180, partial [Candidatus Bathyarchaeota archaeon]|nr:hypothetical protein [Candidatus Bathyarchaeota archaeon]